MFSDYGSQLLRAIFRIYFIVVLALLGIIGQKCCEYRTKLRLLRGKTLRLSEMTGWVRFRDILATSFKLHRLPGGPWLGSIMLFASIFSLVADLTVTVFIRSRPVISRCPFKNGIVLDAPPLNPWQYPPPLEYPSLVATNAQIYSLYNNGMVGIYRKVNDDPTFSAQPNDVMGSWNCTSGGQYDYDGDTQTVEDIINDLLTKGALFAPYDDLNLTAQHYGDYKGSTYTHLTVWTPSIADGLKDTFTVKIAYELGGIYGGGKTMQSYDCKVMTASKKKSDRPNIDIIMSSMYASEALHYWVASLQTGIYQGDHSGAVDNAADEVAIILNTIIMVQGGSNQVQNYPLPGDNLDQGCLISMTWIANFMFGLVAIAGISLFSMLIYFIVLVMRLDIDFLPKFLTGKSKDLKALDPIPNDPLSWMLHATRESAFGEQHGSPINVATVPEKARNVRDWRFQVVYDGMGRLTRLVRASTSMNPPVQVSMVTEAPVGMGYRGPNQQWVPEVAYNTVGGIPWEE